MSPLLFLSWVNCIVSKDILFGQAYYKEISNIHASSFLFFFSLELCKEVQENSVKRQREEILEFSSVQLFSRVQLFAIPWTTAYQASLSTTNSQSLLKLMSVESVMPPNHLILYHPLLFLPSIFSSIRVFSKESVLCIRWPKYWSFSFSISPSNEYSGFTSFRIDWFGLLEVQGTLKSLLQHYS